jgi:hypothetical protein
MNYLPGLALNHLAQVPNIPVYNAEKTFYPLVGSVSVPAPVSVTEICYLHVCVDPLGGKRYGEPLELIIPHV